MYLYSGTKTASTLQLMQNVQCTQQQSHSRHTDANGNGTFLEQRVDIMIEFLN